MRAKAPKNKTIPGFIINVLAYGLCRNQQLHFLLIQQAENLKSYILIIKILCGAWFIMIDFLIYEYNRNDCNYEQLYHIMWVQFE